MQPTKNLAGTPVKRKVLLIEGEAPARALISTFLETMGWKCAVVSSTKDAIPAIERETFDALLLNPGCSEETAEQVLMKIKEIRPSLSGRMLVISGASSGAYALELAERHGLPHVPQEGMLQHLWAVLQDLFGARTERKSPPWNMQIANLAFDSFRLPLTAGVRSSMPATRQLAFQHKNAIIDVCIRCSETPGRLAIAGQILYAAHAGGRNDGLPVILVSGLRTMERTATNRFGEFNLEFDRVEEAKLEILFGESSWVSFPLGKMDWTRRYISGS